MNITIFTMGTQGDVQPYIALGKGLRAAGHAVTIGASERFAPLVMAHGLRHARIGGDFLQIMDTPEGKRALGGNPLEAFKKVKPMLRELLDDCWQVAQGADAIIYHPKALGGYHVAEKLGIPGILAHPVPLLSPTGAFPSPIVPFANLGALNRASHHMAIAVMYASMRTLINTWRREALGLPPNSDELMRDGRPVPRLYGFSEQVVPRPADWDASSMVAGYWFLDSDASWQPPAHLAAFLERGPAPVYVGFGSMSAENAARKAESVLEGLERAGARGVLATGAGALALGAVPENVCVVEAAPHDWLFPRMAAVIHHGGAGTTAAALRAGRPMLICPFFGDQGFWGRRVFELGAGLRPISQKKLSAGALEQAIRALLRDEAMRARAAELGQQLRAEDGVARAVEFVEAQLLAPSMALAL